MKKQKRNFIGFLVLTTIAFWLGTSTNVYSQDATYSLAYGNLLYLNPAFAGADPGWDLAISHKIQWPQVSRTALFSNTTVAFDMRGYPMRRRRRNTVAGGSAGLNGQVSPEDMRLLNVNGMGLGLMINDNREGSGLLRNLTGALVLSKPLYLTKSTFASFGSQIRVGYRQINWDRLVFSGQLDPIAGVVRPSGQIAGFPGVFDNTFYFDMGLGGLLRQNLGTRLVYTGGISFSNLIRSRDNLVNDGFISASRQLNTSRFTTHHSLSTKLSNSFTIAPTFIFENQKPLSTFMLGTYVFNGLNYDYVSPSQNLYYSLFYGGFYRINSYPSNFDILNNHDAGIVFMGIKRTYVRNRLEAPSRFRGSAVGKLSSRLSTLTMGFSYDFTVSRLGMLSKNPTPTGGVFEIHIVFGGNNFASDCFRLGSKNSLGLFDAY